MMLVVSNAGPLISLARIGHFRLLQQVFGRICIPQAVYDEVVIAGAGRAGAEETREATDNRVEARSVQNQVTVRSLLTKLGKGEPEAIALAVEASSDLVLLDDRRARATAEFMGLNVTGTVGLLIRAARRGLVTQPHAVLDELRAHGFRLGDEVYSRVLRSLGR